MLRYVVILQIISAFTIAFSSQQIVVFRQRLLSEVGLTFDPDLKGLWNIRNQQVDQARNEEHKMLKHDDKSEPKRQ